MFAQKSTGSILSSQSVLTTDRLCSAHFQLTRRCNLHCKFCGQAKGVLAGKESELPVDFWLNAARQLRDFAPDNQPQQITLWGGEPLLYHDFALLAKTLKTEGFQISVVTNGTQIDHFKAEFSSLLDSIFISIDGREEVHDAVRGAGTYAKICSNLQEIRPTRAKVSFLTTVSDLNVSELSDHIESMARLQPDEIILGQLIYMLPEEVAEYRKFSRDFLGKDYPELTFWERKDDQDYLKKFNQAALEIAQRTFSVKVRLTRHRYGNAPDTADTCHCQAPWNRIHIRHDGEVGFCTDFFGFSAGNLLQSRLVDIINNTYAQKFRKSILENRITFCRHCPWQIQQSIFQSDNEDNTI